MQLGKCWDPRCFGGSGNLQNCVMNLSSDKSAVLEGIYNALRGGGGEAMFSDIYCDRRLPDKVRANEILWGECLSGALYEEYFLRDCVILMDLLIRVLWKDLPSKSPILNYPSFWEMPSFRV